jgi:UDP-2,3-diacylglucosamine hydrolase
MDNFENLVVRRLKNYDTDIVIEGHYHQGSTFEFGNKKYINIPSLCCDNKYIKLNNYEFRGENI